MLELLSGVMVGVGVGGALLVLLLYPAAMAALGWLAVRRGPGGTGVPGGEPGEPLPMVSLIVVVRQGESLVAGKLANALALEYPPERLEVVCYSDGSTDGTVARLREWEAAHGGRVRVLAEGRHLGKQAGLNRAAEVARGEILVFSDADARLEPGAVALLVGHFTDPRVGGVSGTRVVDPREGAALGDAQGEYVRFDTLIKLGESRLMGSTTSNDGKLYAVRRELFTPVPPGVTDDLFQGLGVVARGARFPFEPRALAHIPTPARNPAHEVGRRRRIVARSLRGIGLQWRALGFWRRPGYVTGLVINKVLRRCLPLFGILVLLGGMGLVPTHPGAALLPAGVAGGVVVALLHPWSGGRRGGRLSRLGYYFLLGNLGTLLGVWDALRGRSVERWEPRKGGG